jgi:hypothetical protein
MFVIFLAVVLKKNNSDTSGRDFSTSIYAICAEYFNGLLEKREINNETGREEEKENRLRAKKYGKL